MDDFLKKTEDWNVFDEPWLRQLVGDANMPVRKIGNSRFYMRGYVPSSKGVRSQSAESSLEHDFLVLLEFDSRVARFVAQPFTIEWRDKSGVKHKYTPDVVVLHFPKVIGDKSHIKPIIYEVKPKAVLKEKWAELKPKYKGAMAWAKEFGCIFHLITEEQIRTPYLGNARFLKRYKGMQEEEAVAAPRKKLITQTMRKLRSTTPKQLLEAMVKDDWMLQAELLPWVWNLIVHNWIGTDLSLPLNMDSIIWWDAD